MPACKARASCDSSCGGLAFRLCNPGSPLTAGVVANHLHQVENVLTIVIRKG